MVIMLNKRVTSLRKDVHPPTQKTSAKHRHKRHHRHAGEINHIYKPFPL